MSIDAGLVLEGGGMRGVYTAGVLEYFLEKEIAFPYVIGVSAGAAMAASYLSKQKGRNRRVNIDYITDPRFISWKNFIKTRQAFGMDFIFDEIPNKLVPYHYDAFYENDAEFIVGTTDCQTGKPAYFAKENYGQEMLKVIKASSSLPFLAPEIHYQNKILLDGGISDPIPIKKSIQDGNKRNVVVLTRNEGYQKKPSKFHYLVKRKYPQYEGLREAMAKRYQVYNDTISYLTEEERNGNVLIIRPTEPLEVGRMERNPAKLEKLYLQGYEDARKAESRLVVW